MANKKALIIGVSGQDGSYLAKFLLKKGYHVIGTSRDVQATSFRNLLTLGIKENIQLESVSLTDFHSVFQVLKTHKPDEIYNLAGQSSVGLSFEQPVETFKSIAIATLNLLETIRLLNLPVRLYNASSSDCFGNTNGAPASESTPFHPNSPYAVAKAAAFWQVGNFREAYGMYACSGILFNHESPLRGDRFVTKKIVSTACRIYKGSKETLFLGNLSIKRDWGWAPEYVDAMWHILQQNIAEDYVIATGKTYSLQEFVETVFSRLALNWKDHVKTNSELMRPSDVEISLANPSKAKSKLSWKAVNEMHDVAIMMVESELSS